ncbi:MAG: hypothetical protein RLY93_19395 [Sumerlaeia bacterium]
MPESESSVSIPRKPAILAGLAIFALLFAIYMASPATQIADSRYTILLSHNLLSGQGTNLAPYFLPPLSPEDHEISVPGALPRQVYPDGMAGMKRLGGKKPSPPEEVRRPGAKRVLLWYSHGPSWAALPFVALLQSAGLQTVDPRGEYRHAGEVWSQRWIAAFLMAGLGVVFLAMGRAAGLNLRWAVGVALLLALATSVYSTASRGLWSHTWGMVFCGLALLRLLKFEQGLAPLQPWLVATLLSWAFFMRPTYAVMAVAVAVYLLVKDRRAFGVLAAVGAGWFVVFAAYSKAVFGQWVPDYYLLLPGGNDAYFTALLANLLSPSRGLLVYTPWLAFLVYLLVRHWRVLRARALAVLCLAVAGGQFVLVARWQDWHGGGGYGPRLLVDLVPWFAVLAVLAADAWRRAGFRRGERPAAALLAVWGLAIHTIGATSQATFAWDVVPAHSSRFQERFWSWRDPQFLRFLPDEARPYPMATLPCDLTLAVGSRHPHSRLYLAEGWHMWQETDWTWAGERAVITFRPERGSQPRELVLTGWPYQPSANERPQPLRATLNGQEIAAFDLTGRHQRQVVFALPEEALKRNNVFVLEFPGAVSPLEDEGLPDGRVMGFALLAMDLRCKP